MKRLKLLAAAAPLALAGGMVICAPALAAEEADTTTVGEVEVLGKKPVTLDQASATASRLDLTPLQTPASIELLSGDVVRERADLSTQDAVSRMTGITSMGTPGDGGGAATARGFSGLGSVMQLYDGMRLYVGAGTNTFPFDPWMVERIEALRGPASTMFGEGAIGGAIDIVPRHASDMRRYDYQIGYGSWNTFRAALGAQGPIVDGVSYRADVSYNSSDNWVQRGDSHSWAASGEVRWQASPSLAFTLRDDWGSQHPMEYFGTPLIDHLLDKSIIKTNYDTLDAVLRYTDNWTQFKGEWTPSANLSVKNDLYYLYSDRRWQNSEVYVQDSPTTLDRTDNFIAIEHHQHQYGDRAEATFRSDLGGMKNSVAVGAEFNRIFFDHINNGFADFGLPGNVVTIDHPDVGLFTDLSPPISPMYHTKSDQYALFAEDQLKFNDQWSLVLGARYDNFKFLRQPLTGAPAFGKTFKYTEWKAGLVYQPVDTLSFYASYATGADPLGSLVTSSSSTVLSDFDLSTAWQAEVGAKGIFMDGRGQWTVALYDIDKKKLLASVPGHPGETELVGERSAKGIEGTLTLIPTDKLRIEANAAYVDAQFEDFVEEVDDNVFVQRKGNTPPNIPKKTANLWVSYQFLPQFTARAGVRFVGRTFNNNANTLVVPSYSVTDLGVDWDVRDDTTVTLRVSNAFDKIYAQSTYADEQWILGRPRSVELLIRGRF
jgi:iron complex outermembrane receptor protein